MFTMPEQAYVFNAATVRVVDGDTIDFDIDLGLHCHRYERIRLFRVNAPEVFGPSKEAGLATKQFVIEWLSGQSIRLQTYKSDVFGRYLAEVWRLSDGTNLADTLLTAGLAVESTK